MEFKDSVFNDHYYRNLDQNPSVLAFNNTASVSWSNPYFVNDKQVERMIAEVNNQIDNLWMIIVVLEVLAM